LNDKGVLVSIIIRDNACDLKPKLLVEGQGHTIASPDLSPHSLVRECLHRFPYQRLSDTPSAIVGMNGEGDEMSVPGEDKVGTDLFAFLLLR